MKIPKTWRQSATLIVLSRHNDSPRYVVKNRVNYDILLQTRPQSGSFPNGVVFPGGVNEPADSHSDWLQLFTSFGYKNSDFESLHKVGSPVTSIFQDNPVQRHIALRLTAIRETFEELGLLICSKEKKGDRNSPYASILSVDTEHWQKRISANPEELLNLCKDYNCYPDIWSLHYWSNWLSPSFVTKKKFDTAFFVTTVEQKPELRASSEVVHTQWATPQDILDRNHKKELELYPPQVYELNRLARVTDFEELLKFARQRSSQGNAAFYPLYVQARDGSVFLLPGDDLYPSELNLEKEPEKVDKTVSDLRENCNHIHRFEKLTGEAKLVTINVKVENHVSMGDNEFPHPAIRS